MKKQQDKISNFSTVMDNKFTNQRMELNNCNNNIIEELRMSQQQIDKFLTEDFCRDICTGLFYFLFYSYEKVNGYIRMK